MNSQFRRARTDPTKVHRITSSTASFDVWHTHTPRLVRQAPQMLFAQICKYDYMHPLYTRCVRVCAKRGANKTTTTISPTNEYLHAKCARVGGFRLPSSDFVIERAEHVCVITYLNMPIVECGNCELCGAIHAHIVYMLVVPCVAIQSRCKVSLNVSIRFGWEGFQRRRCFWRAQLYVDFFCWKFG